MLIQRAIFGKEIMPELLQAVESAQVSISMLIYSTSLPNARTPLQLARIHEAMKCAPSRGVRCRAIFAGWKPGTPQDIENQRVTADLAGRGWQCRRATVTPIMHPKAWIFDDAWLIAGSHNSTIAGMSMTKNISILTNDRATVAPVIDFFAVEYAKAAACG
jgi:phosphatidylserine/phosphatidylglycerophosphate/cardiolipin synthase-like enzyme